MANATGYITRILDVFSKRPEALTKPRHDIPQSTRNRVLLWCQQLYSNSRSDFGSIGKGDYNAEFWQEVHHRFQLRTGRFRLSASGQPEDFREAIPYVLNCPGEEFLTFLEDIFSADCFFRVNLGEDKVVDELNAILRQDDLPYALTHF